MSQHYTTTTSAKLYGVQQQTIRNWVDEFKDYLSPTAQPGRNKQLLFTIEDMKVLGLVSNLRQTKTSYEEIHISLQNGERGPVPDADPMELAEQTDREIITQMGMQISVLRGQLEEARFEAARARELELEVAALRAQVEMMNAQPDTSELYIQIGALRAKLEMAEQEIRRLKEE